MLTSSYGQHDTFFFFNNYNSLKFIKKDNFIENLMNVNIKFMYQLNSKYSIQFINIQFLNNTQYRYTNIA